MKRYQLIVFDWDGTLTDSTGHIIYCIQSALERLGLTPLKQAIVSYVIGLSLSYVMQAPYPNIDGQTSNNLVDTYLETWLKALIILPCSTMHIALLNFLYRQRYFLAIATGKSRQCLKPLPLTI